MATTADAEPAEKEARPGAASSPRPERGAASGGTGVLFALVLSGVAMAVAIYGLLRW